MNIAETRAKLEENHVPKDMYSFGWTTSEMMCIEYKKKHWEVYYSERGSRCGVKTFRKENEACKYFYDMVMQDFKQHNEYLLHYRKNNLRPLLERPYRENDLFYRDDMIVSHSKEEWDRLQKEHNIKFPLDYMDYINAYGLGAVDNVLWIYSPWSEIERFNLFKAGHKVLESYIASLKDFPKGLLPLGRTNNGVDIFWRDTNEDPDKWSLIVCEGSSADFYEYAISITEFLAGVIKGTVQCDVLPENWSGAGHLDFIPYK